METEQLMKMANDKTGKYSFAILIEVLTTLKALAEPEMEKLTKELGIDADDHFVRILETVIPDVAEKLFVDPDEFHKHLAEIPTLFETDGEVIIDTGAEA